MADQQAVCSLHRRRPNAPSFFFFSVQSLDQLRCDVPSFSLALHCASAATQHINPSRERCLFTPAPKSELAEPCQNPVLHHPDTFQRCSTPLLGTLGVKNITEQITARVGISDPALTVPEAQHSIAR